MKYLRMKFIFKLVSYSNLIIKYIKCVVNKITYRKCNKIWNIKCLCKYKERHLTHFDLHIDIYSLKGTIKFYVNFMWILSTKSDSSIRKKKKNK